MEIYTKEELFSSIKNTLANYPAAERHFRLPVFDKPPACPQKVDQYEGGEFDPEIPGAACVVDRTGHGQEDCKVLKTKNNGAKWGLHPNGGRNIEELPHLGILKERCSRRARGGHELDGKRNFTLYKFYLPDDPTKYFATPTAQEAAAVGGASGGAGGGDAYQGASPKGSKGPNLCIIVNMLPTICGPQAPDGMVEQGAATTVSTPPVATKQDELPSTPADASPDSSGLVTGLVERLSIAGASSNAGGRADSGGGQEGGGGGLGAARSSVPAPSMAASSETCAYCGKGAKKKGAVLQRCSRCKQVSYCGAACQQAGWKGHKKKCEPPVPLIDVVERVQVAHIAGDWPEVLKWEGRLDELMATAPDAVCSVFLLAMIEAHNLGQSSTGSPHHALSRIRLLERRVELLGRLELFRDQGEAMCDRADQLLNLERGQDAAVYYQRARDVGAAHGFFSVESRACLGLGLVGRGEEREEGLDLLRNALAAVNLSTMNPEP